MKIAISREYNVCLQKSFCFVLFAGSTSFDVSVPLVFWEVLVMEQIIVTN